jgi:hypothetical protein
MPRMRRRLTVAIISSVALGSVTTVAVSWSLSRRTIHGSLQSWTARRERVGSEGTGFVSVSQARRAGVWWGSSQAVHSGWAGGRMRTFARDGAPETLPSADERGLLLPWIFADRPWPAPTRGHTMHTLSYGWPFPAIAAVHEYDGRGGETWSHLLRLGPPRANYGDPQGVPLRILPRGFTVNTSLAAVFWLAMIVGPKIVRTQIRARRGRCLRCGYDKSGSTPEAACPECGSVPRPRGAHPPTADATTFADLQGTGEVPPMARGGGGLSRCDTRRAKSSTKPPRAKYWR